MRRWWDEGLAAVRDALSAISRYPATAAMAVGLIAFGAAFVILAVVLTWRVVFHPKDAAPYAEQMIVAMTHDPERGLEPSNFFGRRFAYVAGRQTTLECWVASRWGSTTITDESGDRHGASSRRVGRGFRECWGLTLQQGRELRAEDHEKGAEKVAILGERIWREIFAADPSVVGDTVEIGRESVRVVGIATSLGTPDLGPVDVWLPATDDEIELGDAYHPLQVEAYGRPREGVSFEAVDQELSRLDADYVRDNSDNIDAGGLRGTVYRHEDMRIPPEQRELLWASFLPFVGVFLLACANASGLLLIQFAGRARGTALRMVLGASRRALVLRFVLEGLCLAICGGVFGLVALRILLGVLPELAPPLSEMVGLGLGGQPWDGSAVVVAPIAVLAGTLLVALFPGLTATRLSVHAVIQDGARSVSGGRRVGRVRDAIANFLVGSSYLLVVTSVSLGLGLSAAFDQPLGYDARGLVTAHVRFAACEERQQEAREADPTGVGSWPEPEHCAPQRRFGEALAALPLVEAHAIGTGGPVWMGTHSRWLYAVEDERTLPHNQRPLAAWFEVEAGYFELLGTRLVAGRFIDSGDVGLEHCAANFSESLAEQYGGPQALLGKAMYTGPDGDRRCEVVGVVADMNMGAVPVASPVMTKAVYVSRPVSEPGEHETYLVRARGDAEEVAVAIAEWADDAGGGQWELLDVRAVEPSVADARGDSMGLVRLFGIVSTVALAFAGLGIYGIVAYSVHVRRGEHALRMALGATRGRVVFEVLGTQIRGIWPGLALGIVASLTATPVLARSLELPMAFDLVTGLVALAVIVGAVVIAALVPALRAGSIDPWGALREE